MSLCVLWFVIDLIRRLAWRTEVKDPTKALAASVLATVLILLKALSVVAAISGSPRSAEIGVSVGPNVRVGQAQSRQAEPYIAAHPNDANSLIISTLERMDALVGG